MKKTLKVEGMMCGHCEARVKRSLRTPPGGGGRGGAQGRAPPPPPPSPGGPPRRVKEAVGIRDSP